jgi:hypothetical protein
MNWKSIVVITLVAILLGTASATVTFEKNHAAKHLAAPVALIQSGHALVPNNASEPNAIPNAPDVEYTGIDISVPYGGLGYASGDRGSVYSHATPNVVSMQDNGIDMFNQMGVFDDSMSIYYGYYNDGVTSAVGMHADPAENDNGDFHHAVFGVPDNYNFDYPDMWVAGHIVGQLQANGLVVNDGKVYDADGHEHVYQAGYQDGQAGMADVAETSGAMTSMDECDPVTAGDMAEVAAMAQG